jgi:hypothetical protein
MSSQPLNQSGKPLLGNTTGFASPPPASGERENSMSKTVEKYYLQSLARELLAYDHRINVCFSCLSPHSNAVDVYKHPEGKRAYYDGLMVCGMIWVCAVCAARITEERRQELTRALGIVEYSPYLVTYTLRHNRKDALAPMLDGMLEALRKMKSGKAWQWLKDEYSWLGSIRALEVTHGDNGWHPHMHELVILEKGISKSQQNGLLSDLRRKWRASLLRSGFSADWAHGVDLRATSEDVQDYVAKFGHQPIVQNWGIEHEIAKQPVKKGRSGGRTPAQLLSDYGMGDIQAGRLWRLYAEAFTGKKQLVWSKGLRDMLRIGQEATDEEIAATVPSEAIFLARLNPDEWRAVIRADLRAEVLDAASNLDAADFKRWLSEKLEKWL